MRVLGLDEAGRGSVLGPMVVGAFSWEGEDQEPLRAAGAADSKSLSPRARRAARERLAALGRGEVRAVSARAIDGGNINRLELEIFASLVAAHRPDRVHVDAPVHPAAIPRFVASLREALAPAGLDGVELVVEPRADARWPVVGAASIFAKVARDAAIAAIAEEWGEVGSGYPSDPATRAFLARLLAGDGELPPFVRARWGTVRALRQQRLWGDGA